MQDRENVIKETEDGIAFAESRGFGGLANTMRDALALLKEQPEIIRCKDCKFRQSRVSRIIDGKECNLCEMVKGYKPADWFCADGEHKRGGEVR